MPEEMQQIPYPINTKVTKKVETQTEVGQVFVRHRLIVIETTTAAGSTTTFTLLTTLATHRKQTPCKVQTNTGHLPEVHTTT